MITKVSSTYLFHKRGGSAKVSRARVSMFSMTKFATIDETGEPTAVPNMLCVVKKHCMLYVVKKHCPEDAHLNR